MSALHVTVPEMKKENSNISINVSQNNGAVLKCSFYNVRILENERKTKHVLIQKVLWHTLEKKKVVVCYGKLKHFLQ